jgi:hypothetical protein
MHCINAITHAVVPELRGGEAGIAAGVDARERFEVHVHVEGHAVIAAAARDAKPDRRDLGVAHIHTGHARATAALDAVARQHVQHGALDARDEIAHAELAAPEVEQEIDHGLSGPVIRDLTATVGRDAGVGARREPVPAPAGKAEREHRGMLDQPQLVGRGLVP